MRKSVFSFLFIFALLLCVFSQTFLFSQISGPSFPLETSGNDNPEVIFWFKGDTFKVVLAYKGSWDRTLKVGIVVVDEHGFVNVKVQSADYGGVYIKLYRRGEKRFLRGYKWDLKDEVLASSNIYYTLRAALSDPPTQQFPLEVRDANNPEIRWSTGGVIFKVKLESRDAESLDTLRVEDVDFDERGHISVNAYSNCQGCNIFLFRLEGNEWLEIDRVQSASDGSHSLEGLTKELDEPEPEPEPEPTPEYSSLIFRSTFDDHTGRNRAFYKVTVKLNDNVIFNGNPQIEHGKPFSSRFNNFKDFKIEFDSSILRVGQNILAVSLSGVGDGDWFCWDYITVDGTKIESQNRWSTYSPTGVDGVYGREGKKILFTREK